MAIKGLAGRFDVLPRIEMFLAKDFHPRDDFGLKKREIHTIIKIRRKEGMPISFYCRHMDIENGSFTTLVDRLEKKGFITRKHSSEDRRKTDLFLTKEGLDISDRVTAGFNEHLEKKTGNLSEEQRALLFKAFDGLEAFLDSLSD